MNPNRFLETRAHPVTPVNVKETYSTFIHAAATEKKTKSISLESKPEAASVCPESKISSFFPFKSNLTVASDSDLATGPKTKPATAPAAGNPAASKPVSKKKAPENYATSKKMKVVKVDSDSDFEE
jgi:hypothetical protein